MPIFRTIARYIGAHKVLSVILAIAIIGGGYWEYKRLTNTSGETHYVLTTVSRGTIIATVSGSGQVSSENRVDIHPKASGDLISIVVKDGSTVEAGQALGYLDAKDAQKAVRDAQASLESAQISLQKLQQPADRLTLTQAQNASDNAKIDLDNAYETAFNDISNTFLDLPTVMTGLNSVLFSYDRTLGGSNQQNIDFYQNAIAQYATLALAQQYRDDANTKYLAAKAAYDKAFATYKTTSRTASTDSIESLLKSTYEMTQQISDAVKDTTNLIQLYQDTLTQHTLTPANTSTTQLTSLNGYTSTVNSSLTSLSSSVSAIATDKQKVTESAQSLDKTISGADALDVQSSQLSVTQRQNALQDAKDALADYTVRAPFAGIIGNITAHKGDSVSGGTTIATIVGTQQIAQLSLNEVDAAKVKVGQKATLTFDAIEDLSIAGTVADINPIGAVSQGVVSYTIKIAFAANDPRVKPGMTVNATIQTDVKQDVLMVPTSAVKTMNNASTVQVFDPPLPDAAVTAAGAQGVVWKSAPSPMNVQTGISDDTNVEIISGLSEGQQVVARTISGTASAAAAKTTTTRTTGGARGPGAEGGGVFFGRGG